MAKRYTNDRVFGKIRIKPFDRASWPARLKSRGWKVSSSDRTSKDGYGYIDATKKVRGKLRTLNISAGPERGVFELSAGKKFRTLGNRSIKRVGGKPRVVRAKGRRGPVKPRTAKQRATSRANLVKARSSSRRKRSR